MKKISIYLLAMLALVFYSCENDDENGVVDTEPPVFTEVLRPRNEGNVLSIRGEKAESRSETSTHFHAEGTVTDNEGLSELRMDVHSVKNGHSHGRLSGLPSYDVDAVIDMGGVKEFNFSEHNDFEEEHYYYNDQNYAAGPYDVIFQAVDLAGNASDIVVRQIYLRRPYQPTIELIGDPEEQEDELDFEPGDELTIDGFIRQRRGEGALAFDVTFIRLSIVDFDHDDHSHRKDGDVEWEAYWGTSVYLTSSSGGESVPAFDANNTLDFNVLLESIAAVVLTEEFDHKTLLIEVEDAGGNVAIREFELEVHD